MNPSFESNKEFKEERELYYEMGRTLIAKKQFTKAVEFLKEAKISDGERPHISEIYFLEGEAFKNLNRSKESFDSYLHAAVTTVQFKNEYFEETRKIITPSNSKAVLRWFEENKTKLFNTLNEQDKKELDSLEVYCNDHIKTTQLEKDAPVPISRVFEDIDGLIKSKQYESALRRTEEALSKEPFNDELIFLKARILIEGQIDIKAGTLLLNDEDFGYINKHDRNAVLGKLTNIITDSAADVNAYFFAAFIGNILDHDINELKSWIEKAESIYPVTALYILKAEIAEKENRKQEAGENYFAAARNYYYDAAYDESMSRFNQAVECSPGLSEAYVYCADILFLKSYITLPPYIDQRLLMEANTTWDQQSSKLPKLKDKAWHYIVKARIHEALYKFQTNALAYDYWKSLLYGERAVILNNSDYSSITYLARFCRNLDLEINSLFLLETAAELNSTSDFVLEEKAILQLNTGDIDGAEKYLDDLKEKGKSQPFHKPWEGFVHYYKGDYNQAIEILESYVKENDLDIFAYDMLMHANWHANKFEEAKMWAKATLALKYTYVKEELTFAWGHFISGNVNGAISNLENARAAGSIYNNIPLNLAEFYLYNGQIDKAQENFDHIIKWMFNKRLLKEFCTELNSLRNYLEFKHQHSQEDLAKINTTVTDWLEKLHLKINDLKARSISPAEELNYKQEELNFAKDSLPAITLQVSKARLFKSNNDFSAAYAIYNGLLEYRDIFPEVDLAIEQTEMDVFSTSSSNFRKGNYAEVIQLLQNFNFSNPIQANKKRIYLSLAFFALNEYDKSIGNVMDILSNMKQDDELWRWFGDEIATDSHNATIIFNYTQFIYRSKFDLEDVDKKATEVFTKSMLPSLINYNTIPHPVLTPILVEISNNLAIGADASSWYVIDELVPQLRNNILEQVGVKIPGIRFRLTDPDLPFDNFVISLEEVPLKMGTTYSDKLFVHAGKETVSKLIGECDEVTHPLTNKKACWVSKDFKALLEKENIVFWERPFEYLMANLQACLVSNLDVFIDMQFCDDYLAGIEANNKQIEEARVLEKISTIKNNASLMILFNQTLKALVKEQVSIYDKKGISILFLEAGEQYSEVNDIVQYIRVNMKHALPVNKYEILQVQMPLATEGKIKDELFSVDGKTFLAMVPENCQAVLGEIRNEIGENPLPRTKALLVNDSILRIHVRKLVGLEFPDLIIASKEELIKN